MGRRRAEITRPAQVAVDHLMRILVRTSRWAIWAQRLGSLAVPLAIIPILMHRADAIGADTFEIIELVAIGVALLAICASAAAFSRIWVTGDHGWGRAVVGLLCGLLCLVPAAIWTVDFLRYPLVDEVSSDPANPPPLVSGVAPPPPSADASARIAAAFPNINTRHYPVPAVQMFDLVDKLVGERGWDIERRREPDANGGDGRINAVALSLFGFRDEVAIRIVADGDGSSVAMRSAALTALHEPGVNGSRIEDFLDTLDARVSVLMKDEPAGASDDDTDDDTTAADQPPVPAPPPGPRTRKR